MLNKGGAQHACFQHFALDRQYWPVVGPTWARAAPKQTAPWAQVAPCWTKLGPKMTQVKVDLLGRSWGQVDLRWTPSCTCRSKPGRTAWLSYRSVWQQLRAKLIPKQNEHGEHRLAASMKLHRCKKRKIPVKTRVFGQGVWLAMPHTLSPCGTELGPKFLPNGTKLHFEGL